MKRGWLGYVLSMAVGEVVSEPPALHPEGPRDSATRARLDGPHAVRRAFEEPHRRRPRGESAVVTRDVEPDDARDIAARTQRQVREPSLDEFEETVGMRSDLLGEFALPKFRVHLAEHIDGRRFRRHDVVAFVDEGP